MKYDFHVHTARYSPCAIDKPEEICRKAIKEGLSGIAITEHDLWWPDEELIRLSLKFPELTIFRGAEYSCPEGHFLAFLPDSPNGSPPGPGARGVLNLVKEVHSRGGVVIWAHPLRFGESTEGWLDQVQLDGIEVASSNIDSEIAQLARSLAVRKKIRMFYNSDTHKCSTLGQFYNEIPVLLGNTTEMIEYLRYNDAKGPK